MPRARAIDGPNQKDEASVEPVAWENPLIPNNKLRALYQAMVELRLLDEMLCGEEGCRVSTTIDLRPKDLTSDGPSGATSNLLRGAKLAGMADPVSRLHLAMGAAFVLKTAHKGGLLVAYVSCDELELTQWKPLLRFASQQVLPVIFVVLPEAPGTKCTIKRGQLSLASSKSGVPGIPVDAADPVALYRVAQESMLRARAGGGPVLMECIAFQLPGKKAIPGDPIATMREFLLHRKIVDERWLEGTESRSRARLKASAR